MSDDNDKRARRMVRGWKGVHAFIPYGPTQLQQMVKDGRLKPPIKLGPRAIGFFEDDLIEAQQAMIEAQQKASIARIAIAKRD